jgi:hypothetical protein
MLLKEQTLAAFAAGYRDAVLAYFARYPTPSVGELSRLTS